MFLPFIGFGQCTGNCQNGYGVLTNAEGTYKGYWKDGKVHGRGVFESSSYTYDGYYVNGEKHGQGKMTYANGRIIKGKWFYNEPSANATTFEPTVTPTLVNWGNSNSSSDYYSSETDMILSYDFNNNSPFNIRYSAFMEDDETGFYIGGGFKAGELPTSSGIYEVENGQPIMYDGDATIGSFGPKIEESQSGYYIDAGITRHLFYAFWWSAGLAYERNLILEKREHFYSTGNYWGIEWLENKDESYHKVFIETDVYVKIYDVIAIKYGISYKNANIYSVVGVGYCWDYW